MFTVILLLAGFAIMAKGASLLVDGAVSVAKALRVSDLVIGLTVVAFGTSTPELLVNISASVKGHAQIAIGNVVGSNIFNILVILGISALIRPLVVREVTVWKEIPFCLLAAIAVAVTANDAWIDGAPTSGLSRIDGLVLLMLFAVFCCYLFEAVKAGAREPTEDATPRHALVKAIGLVVVGLIGLNLGAHWVVVGSIRLAELLGVSESLIGLTLVAAGTSLPELTTSVVAARNNNPDIAVGNVVGSNIFNVLFILGISAIIRPLPFDSRSNLDVAVMVGSTSLLFLVMFSGTKRRLLERWEGAAFLAAYLMYVVFLLMLR